MSESLNEFWVRNISNKNVSLYDLGITIRKGVSCNLLDTRRYNLTPEQVNESYKAGSLFLKRDKIKQVFGLPEIITIDKIVSDQPMQRRKVSAVKVEEVKYDELNISDEQFADEFS